MLFTFSHISMNVNCAKRCTILYFLFKLHDSTSVPSPAPFARACALELPPIAEKHAFFMEIHWKLRFGITFDPTNANSTCNPCQVPGELFNCPSLASWVKRCVTRCYHRLHHKSHSGTGANTMNKQCSLFILHALYRFMSMQIISVHSIENKTIIYCIPTCSGHICTWWTNKSMMKLVRMLQKTGKCLNWILMTLWGNFAGLKSHVSCVCCVFLWSLMIFMIHWLCGSMHVGDDTLYNEYINRRGETKYDE